MTDEEKIESFGAYYEKRGEIFLGPINFDHVENVITSLMRRAEESDEINLVINSPGGVTDAGFMLAQFIEQEFQKSIIARVWGECSSAATYTLLCCSKRIAHPQAIFVLHRQTSGIELQYNQDFNKRVSEWAKDNKAVHDRQVAFYARKLKLKKKRIEQILERGMGINSQLSATEAKDIGLITHINTPDA